MSALRLVPPAAIAVAAQVSIAATKILAPEAIASDEKQRARQAICRACPLIDQAGHVCTKCGCPIESKTTFDRARCPDNPPRWS
jgi:hypothetical protein